MLKIIVNKVEGSNKTFNEENFLFTVLNTKSGDVDDVSEFEEIIESEDWKEDNGFKFLIINRKDQFNVYYKGLKSKGQLDLKESFGGTEGLIIVTMEKIREYRFNQLLGD